MIISPEHIAPFIVDSLLIIATSVILMKRFSYAGLVLLVNFIVLHTSIYFVLIHFSFWQIFIVDFHLYLAIYGLIVFGSLLTVSKNHYLLKLFVLIEVVLHLILVFFESVDWIYDNYSRARILIASFQIIGLVANVDSNNRGLRSLYTRWISIIYNITNRSLKRGSGILRVEKS